MKLEVITTADKVERVSYLLSLAIKSAKENENFQEYTGLTTSDLEKCELFQKQLLKGYFKQLNNKQ